MPDWTARAAAMGYDPRFWVQVEDVWLPVIAGGGPSGGGGKTTVTSVVNIPPPSEDEKKIQAEMLKLTKLSVEQGERTAKLLEESFPASSALLKEQLALTQRLVEQVGAEDTPVAKEIKALSEQRALSILKGEAPPLSPQQEKFIDETFGAAETEATTSLRTFAEDLAATRGFKLTDTPIGDVALREKSRLSGNLAGAKATAKLDVSQTQQVFQESVAQFRENLRQQGVMNRLALTGGLPSSAGAFLTGGAGNLALPTVTNANILGGMQAGRIAGASRTQTGSFANTMGWPDMVSRLLGGAGAAGMGIGAARFGFGTNNAPA